MPSSHPKFKSVVAIPPVCDFYFTPHRFSNLGPEILCNMLSSNGSDVTFFDFPLMKKHGSAIDIPFEIKYLEDYILPDETGKLSYFTKYQRFGPLIEECAQQICTVSPLILFISCFAFSYADQTMKIAKKVKETRPEITIVVGGAGVSAYPLFFMRNPAIDFAYCGEAEAGIRQFLLELINKNPAFEQAPNLFWKKNGQIIQPSLRNFSSSQEIEIPIRKTYETKHSVYYSTSISRGCGKKCGFCSNFLTHGKRFRTASMEKLDCLFKEIDKEKKHGTKSIFLNFEDDNLLFSIDIFMAIMQKLRKRFKRISFLAENGIDYSLLTPSIADTLINLGFAKFNFTLVSTNREILCEAKRQTSLTHFESIVRHIASRNVPVLSYFICGLKRDSKESVADVLAYLLSLPTQVGISMFYAIPNLPDFKDMSVFDKLKSYVCNGTSAYPWYGTLTTEEFVTAFRLSRYINLLKSYKRSDIESRLIDKIQEEKKLFTLVKNQYGQEIVSVPKQDTELVKMFFSKAERY